MDNNIAAAAKLATRRGRKPRATPATLSDAAAQSTTQPEVSEHQVEVDIMDTDPVALTIPSEPSVARTSAGSSNTNSNNNNSSPPSATSDRSLQEQLGLSSATYTKEWRS